MGRNGSPTPPIDLRALSRIHPTLLLTAADLEDTLQAYRQADRLFWQKYLALFTGPDELIAPDEELWATLIGLRVIGCSGSRTQEALEQLGRNNDWAFLACDGLEKLLKV